MPGLCQVKLGQCRFSFKEGKVAKPPREGPKLDGILATAKIKIKTTQLTEFAKTPICPNDSLPIVQCSIQHFKVQNDLTNLSLDCMNIKWIILCSNLIKDCAIWKHLISRHSAKFWHFSVTVFSQIDNFALEKVPLYLRFTRSTRFALMLCLGYRVVQIVTISYQNHRECRFEQGTKFP